MAFSYSFLVKASFPKLFALSAAESSGVGGRAFASDMVAFLLQSDLEAKTNKLESGRF